MRLEVQTSKPDELRVVGRSLSRRDAADKVAGSTMYAADAAPEGILHARLLRSPLPSARIVRRDVGAALRMDGVVDVLLGEDVPSNDLFVDVPGQTEDVRALKARMQVLATDRVRYQGEPVALIVASTEDALSDALAAIDVEYEELPGVYDPDDALAEGAPAVHDTGNLLAEWNIDVGNPDEAFRQSDLVVDGEYVTQFVDHAYLEPEAGIAWLADDGVITIRASTQVVEHFRSVARILQIPESKVRVIAPYVGGGFGGKEDMTVEPYLALAVHRTGRPVKMVWTRQESLLARPKRHRMSMRYRTAARRDGTILAHEIDITADAGAYAFLSALVLLYSAVTACGPYRVEHVRLRARSVYTNNPPCSAMRGFGAMQVVFAYESQMDRIAHRLGLNGADVRKRNALRRGDLLPVGQEIQTEVLLAETIDAVLATADDPPEPTGPHKRIGRGIASNLQPYGRLIWLKDTASAWVGFELDGSLVVRVGVPDIGAGQTFSLAQIASEVLGTSIDRVSVVFGDSMATPLAGTTTATRQLYMSGNAVLKAAEELRDSMFAVVAEAEGCSAQELSVTEEAFVTPRRRLPLDQVVARCRAARCAVQHLATFHAPTGPEAERGLRSGRIFPDFTFGSHLADVEVDLDTGDVRVLQYVAAHDVGRAINPQGVQGQIAGAAVMGIGSALQEEIVISDGVNHSSGFFSYRIPTAADVPDITTIVLESGEGLGPFGARGIGEAPIGPPAAVLANAIRDAVGAAPTRLPMTPERILAILEDGEANVEESPSRHTRSRQS
jgi:CO/xanthine dehydrogenase Mo-binding subunit